MEGKMDEYNKMLDEFEQVAGDDFEGLDKKEALKVIAEDAEAHNLEEIKQRAEEMLANLQSAKEHATEVSEYQKQEIENLGGSMEGIEESLASVAAEADSISGELVEPHRLFMERMRKIQEKHEGQEGVIEASEEKKHSFLFEPKPGEFLVEKPQPDVRGFSVESEIKIEQKRNIQEKERSLKSLENEIDIFEKMAALEGSLADATFEVIPVEGYPGRAWLRFDDSLTREFEAMYTSMNVSPFIAGGTEEYVRKNLQGFSEEQIQNELQKVQKMKSIRDQIYNQYGFGNVYFKGAEDFQDRLRCYPVLQVGNNTFFKTGSSFEDLKYQKIAAKDFSEIASRDLRIKKDSLEKDLKELQSGLPN